MTEYQMTETYE